jgi:hypothetical protein
MNNRCQQLVCPEQHWNMDPKDKEAYEGLSKKE